MSTVSRRHSHTSQHHNSDLVPSLPSFFVSVSSVDLGFSTSEICPSVGCDVEEPLSLLRSIPRHTVLKDLCQSLALIAPCDILEDFKLQIDLVSIDLGDSRDALSSADVHVRTAQP